MNELKHIKCPLKGFKKESQFTTWYLKQLKLKGFWVKKWSDASQDLKPYDCSIATNKADYHCEIKIIDKESFNFSKFQPNQIDALERLTELNRNAIVVIYSKYHNSYEVFLYKDLKKLI